MVKKNGLPDAYVNKVLLVKWIYQGPPKSQLWVRFPQGTVV